MSDLRKDPAVAHDAGDAGQTLRQTAHDLRDAAAEAGTQASQAASRVRDEASGIAQEAVDEGREIARVASERARGFAEEGKQKGAEQADGIARAIRRAAEELDDSSPMLAGYVRDAASSVERAGRALRERDIRDIADGVQDFARRQPAAFFGVAVLAGFALSRFLKSSARPDDDMRRGADHYRSGYYPGSGMGPGATPAHTTATGAPGWAPAEGSAETSRPATMAAATLGGAAAMRSAGLDENRPFSGPAATEDETRRHQMGGPAMGAPLTGEQLRGGSSATTTDGNGLGTGSSSLGGGATPTGSGTSAGLGGRGMHERGPANPGGPSTGSQG